MHRRVILTFVRHEAKKHRSHTAKMKQVAPNGTETLDTFDFGRFHGKQADELEQLPTLSLHFIPILI